jgi:hypothetical protein
MSQSLWLSSIGKAALVATAFGLSLASLGGVSGQTVREPPGQGSSPSGPYGPWQNPTSGVGTSGTGTSTIDLLSRLPQTGDFHIDRTDSRSDQQQTDREEAAAKAREAEVVRGEMARAASELEAFARHSRPNNLAIIQKIRHVATP